MHRVAIVVDRAFGERLADVVSSAEVWVVDTPGNAAAIRRLREGLPQGSTRLTSFSVSEDESPEAICEGIVYTVDEHHGRYSRDPWSEIEVFGVGLSPALRALFEEIGGTELVRTGDGFVCRR